MSSPRLPVLLSLWAFCVLSRVPSFRASLDPEVIGYLWNFSPLLAGCLFSAATYRSWVWAAAAPLAVYALGDIAVWIASGDVSNAFHMNSFWTYAGVAAVIGCGWVLRGRQRAWPGVLGAALAGATAFFLITNFGSWAMDQWLPQPTGYDRSLAGLVQSYWAALPFWRNDLASLLLFSGLFFSPVGVALLTEEEQTVLGTEREEAPRAAQV